MKTTMVPSRSLLFALLSGLLTICQAIASPQISPSSSLAQRLEYRALNGRDVKTVTEGAGLLQLHSSSTHPSESPHRDLGRGSLRWTASDQNGISEQVAISENGNIVAIGYSLNDERLEVRNAFGGDTLFTYRVGSGSSWVSLSRTGEIIAYAALDSVWLFRSNGRGVPFFRFGMEGYYPGPVALSSDGQRLIATGNDPDGRVNRAWGFNTANGQRLWTLEVDAQEAFNWYGAQISADGRVGVVNGKFQIYVVDAASGELIWEEPTYNTESAVYVSGDGRILVTGSLSGRLRVFARAEQGYEELWHYTFRGASSSWITSVAVSKDGTTIGAGTLDFFDDHYEGRFAVFDAFGEGEPLWISDRFADEIAAIQFNNDGTIVAAVSWGDLNHDRPDLVVHERHSRTPFYTLTTNGSLAGVSISGSGNRVIAGGKATHNRVFGRGGEAHLVELSLLGGFVSGRVRDGQQGAGVPGVTIGVLGNPYSTVTTATGNFVVRVETTERNDFTLFASKRGVGYQELSVEVVPNDTTFDCNFNLVDSVAGDPPTNLRASHGSRNRVTLAWDAYNGQRLARFGNGDRVLSAVGDQPAQVGMTPWDMPHEQGGEPVRDDMDDDASEIRIYRSPVAGGPYGLLASVDGDLNSYIDRDNLFPEHNYYYRITAVFEQGESEYSAEATGFIDDDFLIYDADLQPLERIPRLDGTIDAAEWEGAQMRDISDVFGYDEPDSAGTVEAMIGFSNADDRLYLAVRYRNMRELENNMGLGVYIDDDGDGMWTTKRDGSEGNYWGYWRNGGPDMRYRSITGAPYISDPYYQFENPTLAFGEHETGVEVEMSIPLGFHGNEEVAVYSPEQVIGLGLFAMKRDDDDNPIFHGWWPQDMFSIVSEPRQFGQIHLPVTLTVPPIAPTNLQVGRDRTGMVLIWQDPEMGLDSAAIRGWDGINIYRNGELLTSVDPGQERCVDREFERNGGDWSGWFEYSLSGYVLEDDGIFEGPICPGVGNYLGANPDVAEMRMDDGTAEAFYIVAFNGEDNRLATKFTIEPGQEEISTFWIDLLHRGNQPFEIWCTPDDNGFPMEGGAHYRVTSSATEGFQRFYFPGRQQPRFEFDPDLGGSFWVVVDYLPETPSAPAFGVDTSHPDGEKNLYYTTATGWIPFGVGQWVIRAGVGQPANEALPEETTIPNSFEVMSNFPNPFNGRTFLPVRLPIAGNVNIVLSDLQGRVLFRTETGEISAGEHLLTIEADALCSGMYIATISSGGQKHRISLHLIK